MSERSHCYFEAAFGDIRLLVAMVPPRASIERGAPQADCEVMFVDEPGKVSRIDRLHEFLSLVAQGEPQSFVHPLLGTYRAIAECDPPEVRNPEQHVVVRCRFQEVKHA